MGLTPGTEVTMMKYAPMGDPLEIRLRGYELTLRKDDAARIELVGIHDTDTGPRANAAIGTTEHPALGEGTYSPRAAKTAVPEGAPLHFALAGNQNCGKTTLFNQLTGSNQHVGNFPGVTVDRKDGTIRNHPEASVTDLPGIYSLSPYTGEEIVSRQFILDEHPDAIIDIIDATNIERNLYLTLQLMELDRPMVIALNMMDEVTANGGAVDVNLLESLLGVPVVPISAARNEGIGELVDHALHVARFRERPGRLDFCAPDGPDGGALHRCIHGIANLIEDHAATAHIPVRFAATKLVEGDELVTEALHLDRNELDAIEHIITQMEGEAGTDRLSALADMRFSFIGDVCGRCVVKPHESREHVRSVKIDRILTGRYTAIPAFLVIMGLVFWLTFGVIGAALQGLMEDGIAAIIASADAGLKAFGTNDVVRSLAVDGVLTGVGSVLTFLPIIVVLFLFLSILEDSGYMARVAFVMDTFFGFKLPRGMHKEFADMIQKIAERQGEVAPEQIMEEFQKNYLDRKEPYHFKKCKITDFESGDQFTTVAVVTYSDHGETKQFEGVGNGPIDAVKRGLEEELGISIKVLDYSEHALTSGSGAQAASYIHLMDQKTGKVTYGVGISSNITRASLRGIFSAVNRLFGDAE